MGQYLRIADAMRLDPNLSPRQTASTNQFQGSAGMKRRNLEWRVVGDPASRLSNPEIQDLESRPYQILTRSLGARYSFCPGFTS